MKKTTKTKTKKPSKSRPAATRASDKARVMREEADSLATGVWAAVRSRYDSEVRSLVDGISAKGLTLADVLMLEMAEHDRLGRSIDGVLKRISEGDPQVGHKTLAALCSVHLQTRKHMRTILLSMGPTLTVNDMPVELPSAADMAMLRAAREDLDNGGDEILS